VGEMNRHHHASLMSSTVSLPGDLDRITNALLLLTCVENCTPPTERQRSYPYPISL
jgi:hypothetical protein